MLDALTVALEQASEGLWYVSTVELQLAPFDICAVCQAARTLGVTVCEGMALSLWGADDPLGFSVDAAETRRLPALRAAFAWWEMPAGKTAPVLTTSVLLRDVAWMQVYGVVCNMCEADMQGLNTWDEWLPPAAPLAHSPRKASRR